MHLEGVRKIGFLLRHSKMTAAAFVLMSVLCMLLIWNNADQPAALNDLPKTAASVTGREKADKEFDQTEPNLRVVIYQVSVAQALAYKEEIQAVDGVRRVKWLDDVSNIYEPLEMLTQSRLSSWYRDDDACFYITVQADKTESTVNAIRDIIGEDNRMDGQALDDIVLNRRMERAYLFVLAGGFLLVFLWMAMRLRHMGIARYPLHACGCALLYASADLAVGAVRAMSAASLETGLAASFFLLLLLPVYCSNFYGKLVLVMRAGGSVKKGLSAAAAKTACLNLRPALLGTVLSFLFSGMEYRMGRDLAVALTAAVWIGYVWIYAFLPVSAWLSSDKKEKEMCGLIRQPVQRKTGWAEKAAGVVYGGRPVLLLLTIFLISLSVLALRQLEFRYGTNHDVSRSGKAYADQVSVERQWGKPSYITVVVPKGSHEKEQALSAELRQLPGVIYLDSAADIPGEAVRESGEHTGGYSSLHYSRMTVGIDVLLQQSSEETLRSVQNIGSKYYGTTAVYVGDLPDKEEGRKILKSDAARLVALLAVSLFLLTVLEQRSVIMAVAAVWCGLGGGFVPGLAAYFMDWNLYHTSWLMGLVFTGGMVYLSISVSLDRVRGGSCIAVELTNRKQINRKQRRRECVRLWMENSFGPVLWFMSEVLLAGILLRAAAGNTAAGQMGSLVAMGCMTGLLIEMILVPLCFCINMLQHTKAKEGKVVTNDAVK